MCIIGKQEEEEECARNLCENQGN